MTREKKSHHNFSEPKVTTSSFRLFLQPKVKNPDSSFAINDKEKQQIQSNLNQRMFDISVSKMTEMTNGLSK